MDSTASLVSLHFSAQNAPSMTEPLSAELLQYRLSRTPTPRRFNRYKAATAPQIPEGNIHGQATPTVPRTDFRPASELIEHAIPAEEPYSSSIRIARRRPAPKMYSALSQTTPQSTSTKQPSPFLFNSTGYAESLIRNAPSQLQDTVSEGAPSSRDKTDDLTLNDAIRAGALVKQVKYLREVQEEDIPTSGTEEDLTTVSRSHVSDTQPSLDPAEKRKLKRPAKRTPLPSAPPPTQQQTQAKDGPSSRQYSIPDDERPAKAKKRTRARRLPVDELELAEERLPSYDAPPMSDSDAADSDPVEEPTQRPARPPRKAKQKTHTSNPTETTKKPIPMRTETQSKRADLFAGFKVIKRPVVTNASQKNALESLVVGDGFEGLERLLTGRPVRSANKRRQTRPWITPPTKYYRSLEIVEDKSYLEAPQYEHERSGIKVKHDLPDLHDDHRHSEGAASFHYVLQDHAIHESHELREAQQQGVEFNEDVGLLQVTEEAGNETEEMDNLELPVVSNIVMREQGPEDALSASDHESGEKRTRVVPDRKRHTPGDCPDPATVEAHIAVGASVSLLADEEAPEECLDLTGAESHTQPRKLAATQAQPLSLAEDEDDVEPDIVQLQLEIAQVEREVAARKRERPGKKIKRTVTFSEEVKVVADVGTESEEEEEMDSSDEQLIAGSGSDSGSDSDLTQKSDADESPDEDDEADACDGDPEDNKDDYDDDYPNGNFCPRSSPELVSSGYYARSDPAAQPQFTFNQGEELPLSSDDEGSTTDGEDNMMLDLDEEIEELPEMTQRYAYETGDMADFIDSDEEMLIAPSRSTSPAKKYLLEEDGIEVIELPSLAQREGRMARRRDGRAHSNATIPDSEPDRLFEGGSRRYISESYDMRDEDLPSTRDGDSHGLSQASHNERHADHHAGHSSSGSASSRPHSQSTAPISSQDSSPRGRGPPASQVNPAGYQRVHLTKVAKGAVSTPPTSFAPEKQHYCLPRTAPTTGSRKIKRAKTGLSHVRPLRQSSPARHNTAVTDVPSYFTQASQRLSSPLKDSVAMMRRARTLPSTQYVSESGDEDGFIVMSDESFRERMAGRKTHLFLSDSVVPNQESMKLKDLVKRSNEEMGRSMEVKRKRSLPFKSPFKEQTIR